jgi:aminoglycoside phosphotransferase (APT) family kinase protein
MVKRPHLFIGLAVQTLQEFLGTRKQQFLPKADVDVPDHVLQACRRGKIFCTLDERQMLENLEEILHAEIAELTPLEPGGTLHAIFEITTTTQERAILRLNRIPDYLHDYSTLSEAFITRRLHQAGFAVPKIRYLDMSREKLPSDFCIESVAEGSPLSNLESEEALYGKALREFGSLLRAVHQKIPTVGFGWPIIEESAVLQPVSKQDRPIKGMFDTWADFLGVRLQEHLRYCQKLGVLSTDDATQIESFFHRLRPLFDDAPSVLLHNDPGPANLLIRGRRELSLIDWEDAIAGDPLFDLAAAVAFQPPGRHEILLDSYFRDTPRPLDFGWRFWFYFTRISLARTVSRARFGIIDPPGRTPAHQRISYGLDQLLRLDQKYK